ncbi:hypothetical protein [Hoylesella timonensis]|uniref:hypothetical protein n=1 Tax=Hoylesella timonensis TaxID=386414 RepID=UPI0028894CCE|nr:hypothetical protein [Hoylesella timonensis]
MRKTETSAAVVKAAYIRPNIVCIAVEYSLCAVSPFGGGAGTALPDPEGELLEEEEEP